MNVMKEVQHRYTAKLEIFIVTFNSIVKGPISGC